MKDRDTLYRILQSVGMACAFDSWIPGFNEISAEELTIVEYAERVVSNAITAGKALEKLQPNFFGNNIESPFIITSGQSGKVRGDVFEFLCRAILWNCAYLISLDPEDRLSDARHPLPNAIVSSKFSRETAAITLGDNYDLKQLLVPEYALKLKIFEDQLARDGSALSYSTPDLVFVDISSQSPELKSFFARFVKTLSSESQHRLSSARSKLEGHVHPKHILFAAGIKTSIRSDRMYQFLYEANAWKLLWRRVFNLQPSKYYVVTSQTFGADAKKLCSVDFSSIDRAGLAACRAIDDIFTVTTPTELIQWFLRHLESTL